MKLSERLSKIPNDLWVKISQIDVIKGKWSTSISLSPQYLSRLERSVLIESTGSSNRIEGVRLTDKEVKDVVMDVRPERFAKSDQVVIKEYYELINSIFQSYSTFTFTEKDIKFFHKELFKYSDPKSLHPGKYKTLKNKEEQEVLYQSTSDLITWLNETIEISKTYHPLLVVGSFVLDFLYLLPFQDGNGRLSRLLTNLILLKSGYQYVPYVSYERFVEENRVPYFIALRESYKTFNTKNENINSWLDFFLNVLLEQARHAEILLTKENIEAAFSKKQSIVWNYLQDVEDISPIELSKRLNIPRPTINQILNKFLKFRRIERIGSGSATRYRVLKV